MTKSLLDTDIISELLRGKNERILRRGATYRSTAGHYTTSVISVFEIISGFQQAGYLQRIDEFHKSLVTEDVIPRMRRSQAAFMAISSEPAKRSVGLIP